MSSEPNQLVDVANLRMVDRLLTKAGFRGERWRGDRTTAALR